MGSTHFQMKNAQERRHRNGAPRPGLQHETGNEHSERWRIDGCESEHRIDDPDTGSRPPTLNIRVFYKAWVKRRSLAGARTKSALYSRTDIAREARQVRFVPLTDSSRRTFLLLQINGAQDRLDTISPGKGRPPPITWMLTSTFSSSAPVQVPLEGRSACQMATRASAEDDNPPGSISAGGFPHHE